MDTSNITINNNAAYGLTRFYQKWQVMDETEMQIDNIAIAGLSGDPTVIENTDVDILNTSSPEELDILFKNNLKIYYQELPADSAPNLISIKGGSFSMGNSKPDQVFGDETIIRTVEVSSFLMAETEVTQAQYAKVMETLPLLCMQKNLKAPVYGLSWGEAVTYCQKLSLQFKDLTTKLKDQLKGMNPEQYQEFALAHPEYKLWRLPTEAEWEFAAKGGTKSKKFTFSGGNDYAKIAVTEKRWPDACATRTPNELGLFDMSGNVAEWCSDWYAEQYDPKQLKNPTGPKQGTEKVIRGGTLEEVESFAYPTTRFRLQPSGGILIGFRPVRSAGK
jgi:formylglycine-generating enzyme required for sulfatase activity